MPVAVFQEIRREVRSRAADPPTKGQTFVVGFSPSLGSVFYLISTGRSDVSLSSSLLVLGRRAQMRRPENPLGIIPVSASLIPGCAGLNSRFALLREFTPKGLIRLTVFAAQRRLCGNSDEIPGATGKAGNWPPSCGNGPWRSHATTAPICVAGSRSSRWSPTHHDRSGGRDVAVAGDGLPGAGPSQLPAARRHHRTRSVPVLSE
jgi:hypothetical protein